MHVFRRPRLAIIDEGAPALPAAAIVAVIAIVVTVALAARYAMVLAVAAAAVEVCAAVVMSVALARQQPLRRVWRAEAPVSRRAVTARVIPAGQAPAAEIPVTSHPAIEAPVPQVVYNIINVGGPAAAEALAAMLASGQHEQLGIPSPLPVKENP